MATKHSRQWWTSFQAIGYIVGGVAALGTVIVVANRYITLPNRVEAAEQEIDDLKGWAKEIQGYTHAMQQQQQVSNSPPPTLPWIEHDEDGCWECWKSEYDNCWSQHAWLRCP